MITLYGGGPGFGLPEVSAYVRKTEVQLKMAGLTYEMRPAAPPQSPKGQLPFIDDDGEIIADSTFIRLHIERKYGIDLDDGLNAVERAQAWAIERMIENHLGWVATHASFSPENFEKGPSHFFDDAPEDQRPQLREGLKRAVATTLHAVGISRHSDDEILMLGDRSLSALSVLLGGKRYLMGERPCGVDAIAFSVLAGILTPYFDSPLRRQAETYDTLRLYVGRMMSRYYPDHSWNV